MAADHGLGRDVLGREKADLDLDAALLGPVDGGQEVQHVSPRDVAEGHVHGGVLRLGRLARNAEPGRHGHGQANLF